MATIHDWDVIVVLCSIVRNEISNGNEPPRIIHIHPYSLLKQLRRNNKGKRNYQLLRKAMDRLATTAIDTTIRPPKGKKRALFNLIDRWDELTDDEDNPLHWEIALPQWLWDAVVNHTLILKMHDDYFMLRKGTDKFFYRTARKHAGRQPTGFIVSLEELYNKTGTSRAYRKWVSDYRYDLTDRIILDYAFDVYQSDEGREMVHMIRLDKLQGMTAEGIQQQARSRAKELEKLDFEQRKAAVLRDYLNYLRLLKRQERFDQLHPTARLQAAAQQMLALH